MKPKLTINKMYKQASVIVKHKWVVFKCCRKAGYTWAGITHDLSKFSPKEFLELSRYQIDGSSPVSNARSQKGYSMAWQHHKGHNPHHWEYWLQGFRPDKTVPIKMPFRYVAELFCDYMGAGIVYGENGGTPWTPQSAYDYWETLRDEYSSIHPETKALIEEWYQSLLNVGLDMTLKNIKKYEDAYNNGQVLKYKEVM